jgi:hypothetical protein
MAVKEVKELHKIVTINNEDYSITANKVANQLTIKGDNTEALVFDGSETKLLSIKGAGATSVSVDSEGNIIINSDGGGGEVALQNTFSKIAVSGQKTVSANKPDDTLTLIAGDNIVITTNSGDDRVTIGVENLISNGTEDPTAEIASRYYFKY